MDKPSTSSHVSSKRLIDSNHVISPAPPQPPLPEDSPRESLPNYQWSALLMQENMLLPGFGLGACRTDMEPESERKKTGRGRKLRVESKSKAAKKHAGLRI